MKPVLRSYYVECKSLSEFRTTAWDLASLLIKPVQRFLKYPLLLDQIYKTTPKNHPDRANLKQANLGLILVAEHINNSKKRQDIVGHVISRDINRRGSLSSSTSSQGSFTRSVSKKITRSGQKVAHSLGLKDRTTDEVFDALTAAVDSSRTTVLTFACDMKDLSSKTRLALESQVALVETWREIYAPMRGEPIENEGGFERLSSFLEDVLKPVIQETWQELVSASRPFNHPSRLFAN